MGSSSGSDSDDSKHSKKEKKVKVKKADKEDKSDKEEKSDKEGKSDKPKKEKKDKGKDKEKEKSKDKDKEKSKDKDKDKDKDKEHKEGKEDKEHKESKESKHEAHGVEKIPGVAGVILGAAISGLTGGGSGKREVPAGAPSGASAPAPAAPGHLDASKLPSHARLLCTTSALPPPNEVGFAACTDVGGEPLFLVLAPYDGGLHPGKMVVRTGSTNGEVYFAHKGHEIVHQGDFALVPFDPARMQWVPSPKGVLPSEYKAVDGGYEADGTPLYFALGLVDGGRVPGKASSKLGGACVALGGKEVASETAEILCWR